MEAAGCNGDDIADKYKKQGLRVIAVDPDGSSYAGSEQKWRAAGANFPLYTRTSCSFDLGTSDGKKYLDHYGGYPSNKAVKKWVVSRLNDYSESGIRDVFGFTKP